MALQGTDAIPCSAIIYGMKRIVLLLLSTTLSFAQDSFHLKPGDTVVFYGDSITDQRLYTTFVETYAVTRFPKANITFVHSGWGGDRVSGGGGGPIDVRLRRDVFAYKPTVMTIMLGMNDGRYRAFEQSIFDEYANGYQSLVKSVKSTLPNVRLTFIQPSPYDDVTRPPMFPGGYNAVLVRFGAYLKELGQKEKALVADMNTPVVEDLKRANAIDAPTAQKLVADRVHPGPAGHLLMAKALLKAWNAPAVVSTVEIDGAAGKVIKSENTSVKDLAGLRWTQLDQSLPLPLNLQDPTMALAVKASDVIEALNRQMLKVSGLAAGSYRLTIDDDAVGSFTNDQLAAGINLATLNTPMSKQAAAVHQWTLKHNTIHFARWRIVQVPLAEDSISQTKAAMDALDRLEAGAVIRQRETAQPKPHRFALAPEGAAAGGRP